VARGRLAAVVACALAALAPVRSVAAQRPPPYRNPRLPVEQRVRDLLGRMTLEEKFWQLYMLPGGHGTHDYSRGVFGLQDRSAANARADAELHNAMQRYFSDSTRLGIPVIPFEEGVHGLMRRGAIVFPQAIALAATFDSMLVTRVADAIAVETRSRGIRQVLSPVVNIATDVRWGRVEETYGEDPVLASVMGRVFVRAFERRGVIATPKHFVANVGDGGRDSYPIEASARLLEEVHYPPFREAIQSAGARSVMTSYNSVDGSPASQNAALLNGTLRQRWGFSGFVISDQSAVGGATVLHHTEASTATATRHAIESGLDVIFQSSYPQHRPYLEAFRSGIIADSAVDRAVARVLRAKFQLGLFEHPYVNPDSAVAAGAPRERSLSREAARASLVLLRNERGRLPLRADLRTVAIIGADAAESRLGGYTIDGAPGYPLLAAMLERLGRERLRFATGPGRGPHRSEEGGALANAHAGRALVVVPRQQFDTLTGEYWDNNRLEGAPRIARADPNIDFRWTLNSPGRGIPFDWYSVRWTGRLRVPASGARRLGVEGNDGYRLYLDGTLLIDNWRKQSYRTTVADVALPANSVHDIRLEYFESTGNARVKLVWDAGTRDDSRERIDSAVAQARASDVAVIVAGIEEGEFRDRASLALPGQQEELILRVADTGTPVVVVLIGGSAITMSRWIDRVDAVLMAWYPGEEGGRAIADVLLGDHSPAGRLPITFPVSEGQLPLVYNHKPTGRGDDYVDLTGMPAFPFGFGLSYTTFEYSRLTIEAARAMPREGSTLVRFRVRNAGRRAGDEVVQLYVRDVLASVARPVMELKAFTRIHLAPGEEREVAFPLAARDLRMLDANMRWVVEPGTYRVLIGASSKDIRLRGEVIVAP
jgi:beta-glucosidase